MSDRRFSLLQRIGLAGALFFVAFIASFYTATFIMEPVTAVIVSCAFGALCVALAFAGKVI